jgi:hypothetical protein
MADYHEGDTVLIDHPLQGTETGVVQKQAGDAVHVRAASGSYLRHADDVTLIPSTEQNRGLHRVQGIEGRVQAVASAQRGYDIRSSYKQPVSPA